jgi:hypothetical protein
MEHFDLAVIGSGSGNVVIPEYRDGRKAALIELGSSQRDLRQSRLYSEQDVRLHSGCGDAGPPDVSVWHWSGR